MKCPHCNQEHSDEFQFCPITGKKIEVLKACTQNPDCPDRGKYILPLDSLFCPTCGYKLENSGADIDVSVLPTKYVKNPNSEVAAIISDILVGLKNRGKEK